MNIYRAISNLYMGVALRENDSEGNTLEVHRVEFSNGYSSPNFVGGSLATKDPIIIKLLDESPRNVKNGGVDWKLEQVVGKKESKAVAVKEPIAPKETLVQEADAEEVVVFSDPEEQESDTEAAPIIFAYEDITTNREASAILKGLDSTLTSRDTSNQAKINQIAAKLNVSFPNL